MLLFSGTYFGVLWDAGSGSYPQASSNCAGIATCAVLNNTCLCDVNVQTTAVFDGTFAPTVGEMLSQLYIGAPEPSLFGANYTLCLLASCTQSKYEIWSKNTITNLASAFDAWTIFKISDPSTGEVLLLSNTKSIVDVGGGHKVKLVDMCADVEVLVKLLVLFLFHGNCFCIKYFLLLPLLLLLLLVPQSTHYKFTC